MNKTNSIELPGGFEFLSPNGKSFPRFKKDSEDFGDKKRDVICGFSKSMKKTRQYILLSSSLFHKKYVYKYFDRRKFPKYIRKNQFSLYFREISEWNDPYEKRFYNADYSKVEGAQFLDDHRKVYACCFTSQKDSEPSWKMYVEQKSKPEGSTEREICIQARFDFKALLDSLNDYIENELQGDFVLIVCPVEYMNKVKINGIHHPKQDGKPKDEYFKNFDFSKYLRLLSLKRDAFIYEKEIRFFLIPKNQSCPFPNLIRINNESPKTSKNHKQEKILDKVILDYMSKEDEIKDFRESIKDLGLDDESIVCSDLMAPFDDIKIGETWEEQQRRLAGR